MSLPPQERDIGHEKEPQGPQVLIVDDDRELANLIPLALGHLTNRLKVVYTAREALELISQTDRPPDDLALVDYRLGGQSGVDVAKALKEKSDTTYIALMTGGIEEVTEKYSPEYLSEMGIVQVI